jgi:hypothetical protein
VNRATPDADTQCVVQEGLIEKYKNKNTSIILNKKYKTIHGNSTSRPLIQRHVVKLEGKKADHSLYRKLEQSKLLEKCFLSRTVCACYRCNIMYFLIYLLYVNPVPSGYKCRRAGRFAMLENCELYPTCEIKSKNRTRLGEAMSETTPQADTLCVIQEGLNEQEK